ncbi:MAG: methyl-accepting chemotaxis protein, partial [Fibromonadales bacterium]|nr:methyl-accepting chemotaxis protein [Fibromonadales bacterium]
MNNIKMGPKLIASFLFLAALAAFMGIRTISSLKTVSKATDIMYDTGAVPLGVFVTTAVQCQELRVAARNWQLARTPEARAKILKNLDDINDKLNQSIYDQQKIITDEAGKKILQQVIKVTDDYTDSLNAFIKRAKAFSVEGVSLDPFPDGLNETGQKVLKDLDAAKEYLVKHTSKLSDDASADAASNVSAATVILVVVILFAVALGIFLTLSITSPLRRVVGTLGKIEKGDMTVRVNMERGDEFGQLSKSVDSVASKLQTIMKDLHMESDSLATSAEELSVISRQLVANSEETANKSKVVMSVTEEAAKAVTGIASTAEEASASITDVASSV